MGWIDVLNYIMKERSLKRIRNLEEKYEKESRNMSDQGKKAGFLLDDEELEIVSGGGKGNNEENDFLEYLAMLIRKYSNNLD